MAGDRPGRRADRGRKEATRGRLLAELEPPIVAVCDGRIWCSRPGCRDADGTDAQTDLTPR
ncbi:hypothetical protein I552_3125 [Mycobacterium xenopi 3993]|nr:hypothetical protein I552_3125 [Mycobacterium xenopi 3993]